MDSSCDFINKLQKAGKTEEKSSKNKERKNQLILTPIHRGRRTPKAPRIHSVNQLFLEVNDNAEEVVQPLLVPDHYLFS